MCLDSHSSSGGMPSIDLVIALYNEQESLAGFHKLLEETVLSGGYTRLQLSCGHAYTLAVRPAGKHPKWVERWSYH